ncbi:Ig-like domain-containing protein [Bdellovibrio sp. HCB209]|uniref:Ig-like domain-containing protein n=1 Tax=Bdellovibrio sp. HCB209 TaxID=3394354 RepID=UPI0039B3E0C7
MKMRLLGFAIASAALIVTFQNCAPQAHFTSMPSTSLSTGGGSTDPKSIPDMMIETKMNTAVEFQANQSQAPVADKITFIVANQGAALNGKIEVLDKATYKFKYTPNYGFRGTDTVIAVVADKDGATIQFNIKVSVGNAFQTFQPALAIRGMGCIQCHAQVASNIITDFGYQSSYFMGQGSPSNITWTSGSVYGDHGNNFNTIAMPADKSVIVPKATLPAAVASAAKASTLAEYLKAQLASSTYATTKGAQVQEKKSVYIGAPTDANITSAFQMAATDRMKYFKDSDASVALSGLKDEGTFFQNSGTLNCEGDLAIRGPLLLENVTINSKTGCRLYVVGSVFMYGAINYANTDSTRNLQITSSKSISMGLGVVKKDGNYCNTSDNYALNPTGYGTSSLVNRYSFFWTVPGNFVRGVTTTPKAYGDAILAEAALIEAKKGPLYDAACRTEGRNVSFERILLNAPQIHSRYEGNVSGTVIAEISIMSLNKFKFTFDQVFASVPIFPFLDKSVYLDIVE